MFALLWVMLGSALGGGARYLVTRCLSLETSPFSWAVLGVNVAGSLCIGALAALFLKYDINPQLRIFLTTGLLGGFTTFSAFSLQSVELLHAQQYTQAATYILGSVILSLAACFLAFYGLHSMLHR